MARRPSPGVSNKKHANDDRQHNEDQLKPEMRHVLSAYQTNALHHAANNQYPAEETTATGHGRLGRVEARPARYPKFHDRH